MIYTFRSKALLCFKATLAVTLGTALIDYDYFQKRQSHLDISALIEDGVVKVAAMQRLESLFFYQEQRNTELFGTGKAGCCRCFTDQQVFLTDLESYARQCHRGGEAFMLEYSYAGFYAQAGRCDTQTYG